MTPTLAGRWQTRVVLAVAVGLPVCLAYGRLWDAAATLLAVLGYALALGLAWDVLYIALQGDRWDHDWPVPHQIGSCLFEAATLWVVLSSDGLWHLFGLEHPPGAAALSAGRFALHFATVWLLAFVAVQGPLKILFPRWRFSGGRFF